MGKSMFLTGNVAAVLVGSDQFAPGVADDERVTLAQAVADDVMSELVALGVQADAFATIGSESAEFVLRCTLVDRVRLYALGLGQAPMMGEMSSKAQSLWAEPWGRKIADDWANGRSQELAQMDGARLDLVGGELSPRGLGRARALLNEVLADLLHAVELAASKGRSREDVSTSA